MQNRSNPSSGGIALRRRTVSLAIASLLAASGAAQAFEIDTGNDDLAMRWDNTVRYNLGVRAQGQDSSILGSPNFDDGDRNFSNGSIVTNRFDVLSEFDLVWQKKLGFRVSAAGWWDAAYNSLDNTNTATANTLVNGLPAAGVLSPVHEALRQGRVGRMAGRVRLRQLRHRRHAGQRQGRPAHRVLGRQPAPGRRGPRRVVLAELARRVEGVLHPRHRSEGAVPAARRAHDPGPADQRPVDRRPVVLQLAGGPRARIRQLPDRQRRPAVRRRLDDLRPEPVCRADPGRAGVPAPLERDARCRLRATRAASATGAFPRAGARSGSTARWASTTATRPTSCRRSWRPSVPCPACRRRPARRSAAPSCRARASSTRTRPTPRISRRRASSGPTTSPTATTSTSTASRCRRSSPAISVGAELSYRENMPLLSDPVVVLPAPLVNRAAGEIATTEVPAERQRRARWAIRCTASSTRSTSSRRRRCSTPRRWRAN